MEGWRNNNRYIYIYKIHLTRLPVLDGQWKDEEVTTDIYIYIYIYKIHLTRLPDLDGQWKDEKVTIDIYIFIKYTSPGSPSSMVSRRMKK